MCAVLADHHLRKDTPVGGDERRGAIVAGRLKTKDYSHFASGPLPDPGNLH
jgi:hypothetical protein